MAAGGRDRLAAPKHPTAMEVTTAKRPAQRRKSAKKAKEAEDLVVPVGEHGTLEGLPTELLEDIVV